MVVHAPHPQSCGSAERPQLEQSEGHTHLRLPSQLPLQGAGPSSGAPARPYPQNHCLGSGPDNRKLGALSLHCLSFPARPCWRGETAPPPGPPPPAAEGGGIRHSSPLLRKCAWIEETTAVSSAALPQPSKGQDSSCYHRARGWGEPPRSTKEARSLSVSLSLSICLSLSLIRLADDVSQSPPPHRDKGWGRAKVGARWRKGTKRRDTASSARETGAVAGTKDGDGGQGVRGWLSPAQSHRGDRCFPT